MFSLTTLLAYVSTCLILTIVPGPTVSVVVSSSLARGTRAGLMNIVGTQLGMASMVVVVAFGMQTVIGIMGWAFDWVKLAGAAYLIWIGVNMIRSDGRLGKSGQGTARTPFQDGLRGFVVIWSNPKALIFLGALLPQFIDRDHPAFPQIIALGLIFMALASTTDCLYAVLAGRLRHWLSTTRVRVASRISGVLLVCGGIWLALLRRT